MGKTTLLHQIHHTIRDDFANSRVLPVFFNPAELKPDATLVDFFSSLLSATLEAVNRQFGRAMSLKKIELPRYFEYDPINDFISPVLDEIRRQVPSPYFYFLWMIDDLCDVTRFPWNSALFSLLRALLYSSRKSSEIILLLSGRPRDMQNVVTNAGSPLANIMEIEYLNVLSTTESQALIQQELTNAAPDENVVSEIIRQTGGHPYLLNTLLHQLQQIQANLITTEHVKDAVTTFPNQDSLFAEWLSRFSSADKYIYQTLLNSGRPLPAGAFRELEPPLSSALRPLKLLGVIQQNDDKTYRLNIDMFKDWVLRKGYFA